MHARTSVTLVILAVLLAGAAWYEARFPADWSGDPIVPIESSVSQQVDGESPASLERYAPPALATLTETVERPLFNSTRRVQEAPEVPVQTRAAPVVAPVNPPNLSLTAVVIDGDDRVAVVSLASRGAFERLREGDQVEGWSVQRIDSQGVRLVRGDSTHEIELRSFQAAPARPRQVRSRANAGGSVRAPVTSRPAPRRSRTRSRTSQSNR